MLEPLHPRATQGPAQSRSRPPHPSPTSWPQSQGHTVRGRFTLPSPFVCSVIDAHGSNEKFLKDIYDLVSKAKCKLIICPWVENRNDRWIQVDAGADPGGEWGGPGDLSPAFTWLWERACTGS